MKFPATNLKSVIAVTAFSVATGVGGVMVANADSGHVTESDIPNLGLVKTQIKAYYGDTGSAQPSPTSDYAREIGKIEQKTERKLPRLVERADAAPVIVLDVDDTTLSTYNYEVTHDFGFDPVENAAYIHDPGMGPVFGMPDLANYASQVGADVYYLTGRPESQRADTMRDLAKAGYPDVAADHLYMRNRTSPPSYLPCEPTCTTTQYKSLTREHIEPLGNDIVLNMGDQLSDLAGGFADYTAKVPNPMYYIP
jgi:predicted secreted acid phosphatase